MKLDQKITKRARFCRYCAKSPARMKYKICSQCLENPIRKIELATHPVSAPEFLRGKKILKQYYEKHATKKDDVTQSQSTKDIIKSIKKAPFQIEKNMREAHKKIVQKYLKDDKIKDRLKISNIFKKNAAHFGEFRDKNLSGRNAPIGSSGPFVIGITNRTLEDSKIHILENKLLNKLNKLKESSFIVGSKQNEMHRDVKIGNTNKTLQRENIFTVGRKQNKMDRDDTENTNKTLEEQLEHSQKNKLENHERFDKNNKRKEHISTVGSKQQEIAETPIQILEQLLEESKINTSENNDQFNKPKEKSFTVVSKQKGKTENANKILKSQFEDPKTNILENYERFDKNNKLKGNIFIVGSKQQENTENANKILDQQDSKINIAENDFNKNIKPKEKIKEKHIIEQTQKINVNNITSVDDYVTTMSHTDTDNDYFDINIANTPIKINNVSNSFDPISRNKEIFALNISTNGNAPIKINNRFDAISRDPNEEILALNIPTNTPIKPINISNKFHSIYHVPNEKTLGLNTPTNLNAPIKIDNIPNRFDSLRVPNEETLAPNTPTNLNAPIKINNTTNRVGSISHIPDEEVLASNIPTDLKAPIKINYDSNSFHSISRVRDDETLAMNLPTNPNAPIKIDSLPNPFASISRVPNKETLASNIPTNLNTPIKINNTSNRVGSISHITDEEALASNTPTNLNAPIKINYVNNSFHSISRVPDEVTLAMNVPTSLNAPIKIDNLPNSFGSLARIPNEETLASNTPTNLNAPIKIKNTSNRLGFISRIPDEEALASYIPTNRNAPIETNYVKNSFNSISRVPDEETLATNVPTSVKAPIQINELSNRFASISRVPNDKTLAPIKMNNVSDSFHSIYRVPNKEISALDTPTNLQNVSSNKNYFNPRFPVFILSPARNYHNEKNLANEENVSSNDRITVPKVEKKEPRNRFMIHLNKNFDNSRTKSKDWLEENTADDKKSDYYTSSIDSKADEDLIVGNSHDFSTELELFRNEIQRNRMDPQRSLEALKSPNSKEAFNIPNSKVTQKQISSFNNADRDNKFGSTIHNLLQKHKLDKAPDKLVSVRGLYLRPYPKIDRYHSHYNYKDNAEDLYRRHNQEKNRNLETRAINMDRLLMYDKDNEKDLSVQPINKEERVQAVDMKQTMLADLKNRREKLREKLCGEQNFRKLNPYLCKTVNLESTKRNDKRGSDVGANLEKITEEKKVMSEKLFPDDKTQEHDLGSTKQEDASPSVKTEVSDVDSNLNQIAEKKVISKDLKSSGEMQEDILESTKKEETSPSITTVNSNSKMQEDNLGSTKKDDPSVAKTLISDGWTNLKKMAEEEKNMLSKKWLPHVKHDLSQLKDVHSELLHEKILPKVADRLKQLKSETTNENVKFDEIIPNIKSGLSDFVEKEKKLISSRYSQAKDDLSELGSHVKNSLIDGIVSKIDPNLKEKQVSNKPVKEFAGDEQIDPSENVKNLLFEKQSTDHEKSNYGDENTISSNLKNGPKEQSANLLHQQREELANLTIEQKEEPSNLLNQPKEEPEEEKIAYPEQVAVPRPTEKISELIQRAKVKLSKLRSSQKPRHIVNALQENETRKDLVMNNTPLNENDIRVIGPTKRKPITETLQQRLKQQQEIISDTGKKINELVHKNGPKLLDATHDGSKRTNDGFLKKLNDVEVPQNDKTDQNIDDEPGKSLSTIQTVPKENGENKPASELFKNLRKSDLASKKDKAILEEKAAIDDTLKNFGTKIFSSSRKSLGKNEELMDKSDKAILHEKAAFDETLSNSRANVLSSARQSLRENEELVQEIRDKTALDETLKNSGATFLASLRKSSSKNQALTKEVRDKTILEEKAAIDDTLKNFDTKVLSSSRKSLRGNGELMGITDKGILHEKAALDESLRQSLKKNEELGQEIKDKTATLDETLKNSDANVLASLRKSSRKNQALKEIQDKAILQEQTADGEKLKNSLADIVGSSRKPSRTKQELIKETTDDNENEFKANEKEDGHSRSNKLLSTQESLPENHKQIKTSEKEQHASSTNRMQDVLQEIHDSNKDVNEKGSKISETKFNGIEQKVSQNVDEEVNLKESLGNALPDRKLTTSGLKSVDSDITENFNPESVVNGKFRQRLGNRKPEIPELSNVLNTVKTNPRLSTLKNRIIEILTPKTGNSAEAEVVEQANVPDERMINIRDQILSAINEPFVRYEMCHNFQGKENETEFDGDELRNEQTNEPENKENEGINQRKMDEENLLPTERSENLKIPETLQSSNADFQRKSLGENQKPLEEIQDKELPTFDKTLENSPSNNILSSPQKNIEHELTDIKGEPIDHDSRRGKLFPKLKKPRPTDVTMDNSEKIQKALRTPKSKVGFNDLDKSKLEEDVVKASEPKLQEVVKALQEEVVKASNEPIIKPKEFEEENETEKISEDKHFGTVETPIKPVQIGDKNVEEEDEIEKLDDFPAPAHHNKMTKDMKNINFREEDLKLTTTNPKSVKNTNLPEKELKTTSEDQKTLENENLLEENLKPTSIDLKIVENNNLLDDLKPISVHETNVENEDLQENDFKSTSLDPKTAENEDLQEKDLKSTSLDPKTAENEGLPNDLKPTSVDPKTLENEDLIEARHFDDFSKELDTPNVALPKDVNSDEEDTNLQNLNPDDKILVSLKDLKNKLFIVGQGIKLPLTVVKNQDGSLQMVLDTASLCKDQCHDESCPCSCSGERNGKLESEDLKTYLKKQSDVELKKIAERAVENQLAVLSDEDNLNLEQSKEEITKMLQEYGELYEYLRNLDEEELHKILDKGKMDSMERKGRHVGDKEGKTFGPFKDIMTFMANEILEQKHNNDHENDDEIKLKVFSNLLHWMLEN